jgi:hypothetical protein
VHLGRLGVGQRSGVGGGDHAVDRVERATGPRRVVAEGDVVRQVDGGGRAVGDLVGAVGHGVGLVVAQADGEHATTDEHRDADPEHRPPTGGPAPGAAVAGRDHPRDVDTPGVDRAQLAAQAVLGLFEIRHVPPPGRPVGSPGPWTSGTSPRPR